MFDTSLFQAVDRFASVTAQAPDSALDRDWAWGAYDSEGTRFAYFRTYEELRELATRIAAARAAHDAPASTAQRILGQYHAGYRDLQAALIGIQAEEADLAPTAEEWSLKHVVAHIVTAEVGFHVVTKYALDRFRSKDGRPAEIPREAWAGATGMDESSFETMLNGPLVGLQSYHSKLHDRVLEEFADISKEELGAPSLYWEGYEMSLRFRLHRFDSHLRQHTVQADKTLHAIGHPPGEVKRLLRLIYAALAEAEGASIGAWEIGAISRQEAAQLIASRAEEIASALT